MDNKRYQYYLPPPPPPPPPPRRLNNHIPPPPPPSPRRLNNHLLPLPPPPPSWFGPQRGLIPLTIPPPPPLSDEPVFSATFIPADDSFFMGVGIPPDPTTATLVNPQLNSEGKTSAAAGRQSAQNAAVTSGASSDLAAQWSLDRVLAWLAANSFSNDWQETFRTLKIEGSDFLDLGLVQVAGGKMG